MSEYRERKPTSKGLLAQVKGQQRNARMSTIFSVFPKPRESFSLQNFCYVAGSITFQSFLDFLHLSESCWEKAVFVQCHNTSLHAKFRQTALKLARKVSITHKLTLYENRVSLIFDSEKFKGKAKVN